MYKKPSGGGERDVEEFSIIVEYETEDGREDEFLQIIRDHARRTLEEEPGCLRFEVLKPVERSGAPIPNRIIVSEYYASYSAVESHENNPRLQRVRSAVAPLVKSRRLVLSKALQQRPAEHGIRPENLNAANDD